MKLEITALLNGDQTQERITLTVHDDCNLKDYMVADETYNTSGVASNLHRHTFWFPDQAVKKGDIVTVATGKGKPSKATNGTTTTYNYFWGLGEAVWNNEGDKAILVQIAKIKIKGAGPKQTKKT